VCVSNLVLLRLLALGSHEVLRVLSRGDLDGQLTDPYNCDLNNLKCLQLSQMNFFKSIMIVRNLKNIL
jgi:hypothetical protein